VPAALPREALRLAQEASREPAGHQAAGRAGGRRASRRQASARPVRCAAAARVPEALRAGPPEPAGSDGAAHPEQAAERSAELARSRTPAGGAARPEVPQAAAPELPEVEPGPGPRPEAVCGQAADSDARVVRAQRRRAASDAHWEGRARGAGGEPREPRPASRREVNAELRPRPRDRHRGGAPVLPEPEHRRPAPEGRASGPDQDGRGVRRVPGRRVPHRGAGLAGGRAAAALRDCRGKPVRRRRDRRRSPAVWP
jgi:hypothetical protein